MKKTLKTTVTSLLLIALLLLASCGGESTTPSDTKDDVPERLVNKENVIIGLMQSSLEKGFDPCKGWGSYGVPLMQSKLLDLDADNNIINDLATEYSVSSDGLTWTFKLRTDAKFSDGKPVTAGDVAFTYNKTKEIGTNYDFSTLEKASAADDSTVIISFSKPYSAFIYDAASLGIVPEHAYTDTNAYSANPIGSGPYKFVSYSQGQQLILERNDDYYGKKPKFKKLTLVSMSPDTALASLKAGEVDIVNVSEALAQEKIENYSVIGAKSMDFRAVSMPVVAPGGTNAKGNPTGNIVTSDIAIRKAINHGVNRQEMIDNVLYGHGTAAKDLFDSLPWGVKDEMEKEFVDGNIEKANAMLDEADWKLNGEYREKDGVKAEFTLLYPASDDTRQSCAEAFAAQCKKIGIKVVPEGSDWTEMEKRQSKDAIVIGGGQYTPVMVARFHFSEKMDGPWSNVVRENNPVVDSHIRDAYVQTEEDKAVESWKKALWDGKEGGSALGEAPYCNICYLEHLYFVRDGLDIGRQKLHTHSRDLSVLANITEWDYK